ncbi:DNA recombination protein RmuC [bacterium]|nr:DNA recombination protein RmuC [bacterium]
MSSEVLLEHLFPYVLLAQSALLLVLLTFLIVLIFMLRGQGRGSESLLVRLEQVEEKLGQAMSTATADMAGRLERTKGDLRQETADRLSAGFNAIRDSVRAELEKGRGDQGRELTQARRETSETLGRSSRELQGKFDVLTEKLNAGLETVRSKVDERLALISDQVQKKLDQNIKEGFAQFEKVQEHLQAAEERLKEVGQVGESIRNLNLLLKLPHLRGKFGEQALERLLADFLPSHMYSLQSPLYQGDRSRPDAVIHLPDRNLPIDSKFPRERVLALFESDDPEAIRQARRELETTIKQQAASISKYIQPEQGTTDVALMFLPSETLWFEVVRNPGLSEHLNKQCIFPVSPNTLLLALHSISLSYKWYQVAKGFEKTTAELGKAQKSFDFFRRKFDDVGKQLDKAQESWQTASGHLSRYQSRVVGLTDEEPAEIEAKDATSPPVSD